jgi:hypothetical protein
MFNDLVGRVDRLERVVSQLVLRDVSTTGLTSAQIDAAVFGASTGAQPTDGLFITDKTNHLLLVRENNKWCKTATLTIIT